MNFLGVLVFLSFSFLCFGLDLHGKTLHVSGVGGKPFLNLRQFKNGLPLGVDTSILSIVAEKLGFKFVFKMSNGWGSLVNDTWTGTVGDVFSGASQIGIGHVSINLERSAVVSLTTYLYPLEQSIYTRKPRPLPQYFNLVKPFTAELWLSTFLTVVLIILVVHRLQRGNFGNHAINVLGSLLAQGTPGLFNNIQKHMVPLLWAWLAFLTLMNMAYDCNLRAYLIAVDYEKPINNLDDVLESDKRLWLPKGTTLDYFLSTSPIESHQVLYKDTFENKQHFLYTGEFPLTMDKHVLATGDAVLSPMEVLRSRGDTIKDRFGSNPFRIGHDIIFNMYCGFLVKRDSELLEVLNEQLMWLVDSGIVQKNILDNIGSRQDDEPINDNELRLDLKHLLAANVGWVIGILIALMTFWYEIKAGKN